MRLLISFFSIDSLQHLKRLVDERQAKLVSAKAEYRAALRNLESISEEIHAQRRSLAMGTREQGVGAEGDAGDDDVANFKMESDGLSSKYLRDRLLVCATRQHRVMFLLLSFHLCVCMFNVFICVSVMSVSIDEGCSHSSSSEDEADNLTTSSPRASPCPSTAPSSPLDMPSPFPSSRPFSYLPSTPSSSSGLEALDLASPCSSHEVDSVCGSGHVSPLLGPRSQCSGASSPDCEQERGVSVHYIRVCLHVQPGSCCGSVWAYLNCVTLMELKRTTRWPGVGNW